jgi:hypothetical protein
VSAGELNQMSLRRPFEIIVFVLVYFPLNLQKVSEHSLLKVNEPFKFFMINRKPTNQARLPLRLQRADS